MKESKFFIGQVIHHQLFDYRGVIVDVDFKFLGSEQWYEEVASSRPPKDQPWYHVLVAGAIHQTYVAENNLEVSEDNSPIQHPLLDYYFNGMKDGYYQHRIRNN